MRASVCERRRIVYENGTFSYENFKIDNTNLNLNLDLNLNSSFKFDTTDDKQERQKEFRRWLTLTNYEGRCRSTENYSCLSKHDQANFRSQMKAIFRHILEQFAFTDACIVWDEIVDDEIEKPKTTKGVYVII